MEQVNVLQNREGRGGRLEERGNSRAGWWLAVAGVLVGIAAVGGRAYGLGPHPPAPLTPAQAGEQFRACPACLVCEAVSVHSRRKTEIIQAFRESIKKSSTKKEFSYDMTSGIFIGALKKMYYVSAYEEIYAETYGEHAGSKDTIVQVKKTILSEAISDYDKFADLRALGISKFTVRACREILLKALGKQDILSADKQKAQAFLAGVFTTTDSDFDIKPAVLGAVSQGGMAGTPEGLSLLKLGLTDSSWYAQHVAMKNLDRIADKVTLQDKVELLITTMEKGYRSTKVGALQLAAKIHSVEMIPVISIALQDPTLQQFHDYLRGLLKEIKDTAPPHLH